MQDEENEKSYLEEYGLDESGQQLPDPALATTAAHDEATETPEQEAAEPIEQQVAEGEVPEGTNPDDLNQLLEHLKAAGVTSMADIHAAMAQSQAQSQLESEMAELQATLQQAIDSGDMSPEAAQMVFEAKQEAAQMQATIQAQQLQLQMAQQAQAQQELAKIDPALAQAVQQIGLAPEQIKALAGALNGAMNTSKQKAVAEYVAGKKNTAPAPISERGSGPKEEDIDPDGFSFSELFAMK